MSLSRKAASAYRVSDLFLFLYLAAMLGHRSGTGFDYYLLRGSFLAFVFVAIVFDVIPREKSFSGDRRKKYPLPTEVYWFSLFFAFSYVSLFWSVSPDSTMNPLYITNAAQSLCVVVLIGYRIRTKEDLLCFMKILLAAALYGFVVLLIKTPVSSWGSSRIGVELGLNANNVGGNYAFFTLVCLYLAISEKKKYPIFLAVLFILAVLFSGSRRALAIVFVGILIIPAFLYRGWRGVISVLLSLAILSGLFWVVMNVQVFYDVIGHRIAPLLNGGLEASSLEREEMREFAFGMFTERPIFGWGFNCFAAISPWGVYSHCNQLELLADLGAVGFVLYYSVFVICARRLYKGLITDRQNALFGLLLLLIIFVFDYGTVSIISVNNYVNLCVVFALTKTIESSARKSPEGYRK